MNRNNLKNSIKKDKIKNNGISEALYFVGLIQRPVERTSEAVKDEGLVSDSKHEKLFRGWFNNHMTVIVMFIERTRPRKLETLRRIEYFLFDLEHHYLECKAPKYTREAFSYLKSFFEKYPSVKAHESSLALEMLQRIYDAFGIELKMDRFKNQSYYAKNECDKTQKEKSREA